jgi:protein-tyrosine phosphatase
MQPRVETMGDDSEAMSFIDMHCHILPGVDDGSKNMEMSLRMLKVAKDNHIEAMILTPHNRAERHSMSAEEQRERIHILLEAAERNHLDSFRFYSGNELFYDSSLTDRLENGKALTLASSRYCLVEFDPGEDFAYIAKGLKTLSYEGYYPILAHCERYECLTNNTMINKSEGYRRVEELKRNGVLLQVNAGSVFPKTFQVIPRFVNCLLKDEMISFVATDAHRDTGRAPYLLDAAEYITHKYGKEYATALLYDNARAVIRNKPVTE